MEREWDALGRHVLPLAGGLALPRAGQGVVGLGVLGRLLIVLLVALLVVLLRIVLLRIVLLRVILLVGLVILLGLVLLQFLFVGLLGEWRLHVLAQRRDVHQLRAGVDEAAVHVGVQRALHRAVGGEEEVVALAVKAWVLAREHRACQARLLVALEVVYPDTVVAGLIIAAAVRKPARVLRPRCVELSAQRVGVDELGLSPCALVVHAQQVQVADLVCEVDVLGIGGPGRVVAEAGSEVGQLLGRHRVEQGRPGLGLGFIVVLRVVLLVTVFLLSVGVLFLGLIRRPVATLLVALGLLVLGRQAVGGPQPQLVLAALIGEVADPLAIGGPRRAALEGAVGAGQVADHALLGRGGPQVAAGLDDHALTGGRDRRGVDVAGCIHVLGPQCGLGPGDGDLDDLVLLGAKVEEAHLSAELEDDLALA